MGNQKGKLSVSIGDDSSGLQMVDLPIELWELILMNTDAKTLAIAVPRVCKLMNELSARDPIWKFKYVEEYKPDTAPELKDDLTWKKMYFRGKSILFPLYGVYIGKTTKAQLKARSDAKDNGDYFTLEDINFWMHSHPERDVFNGMYIARGIYIIPPSWEKQGITWKRSYDKYKKLLKQLLGNVSEPYAPRHREWQGQQCFQGELTSIASEGGVQYEIKFGFDYTPAQLDISEHDESVVTLKEAIADAEANDRLLQGFVEQPICVKLRIHLFVIGLLIVANASCDALVDW